MFGGVFFIIIIIIVALILLNKGGLNNFMGNSKNDDTPLEILEKRYAKGEISKEEFEKMKKDLEG